MWWGPVQDTNSTRVMRAVLQYATTTIFPSKDGLLLFLPSPLVRSERPDLVVFSGDQITGNNIHSNATRYWAQLLQPCIEAPLFLLG